ncbi:MAG: hypothetical protein Q8927_20130 [Bacteroidota bacterium]|nr:hypothetical protein [Bacteroidota bacterium]MDP4218515.1 hypothetical protein [Bacteroidota bacterium]MDP4245312.1 hypothetical protein [Bacteroidota bacterium]MDP4253381.1 hypothetical protein [Bacteroidota bacterium]MDP4260794.1 hypothetical protein [Bacteroidota bacterium]
MMKNPLMVTLGAALICLTLLSCSSKNKGTPEATLAVTLSPANGTTQPASPGPFNLTVTITSTMPTKGVTIAVTAEPDGSSVAFFSSSISSSQATNNFTITGTPVGVVSVVNVKVTSNSTATNTWSGSYRYSAK